MLGKGGYGKVVLAQLKSDKTKFFAVKIVKKSLLKDMNKIQYSLIEKRILGQLNSNFIISLHCTFRDKMNLYFVLNYMPGGELYFHLAKERRFPEKKAQFYMACVCLAFEYLHNKNIIYRDLKPDNILMDEKGYVRLADFGLSRINAYKEEKAFSLCGTPQYLAPEVILKRGYTYTSDWFSFGVTYYQLLTGQIPHYHPNFERMFKSLMTVKELIWLIE